MSSFRPVCTRQSSWSREELDHAALERGGVLFWIGYSFLTAPTDSEMPVPQHGWGFRWVDRRGMGNHGRMILVPLDGRTRRLWRLGRVKEIERELECSTQEADALLTASRGVMRGGEMQVLREALRVACLRPDDILSYPGAGNGVGRWRDSVGFEQHISCQRMDSAVEIARKLLGL